MAKKFTVKSKYRNPDAYIARLKRYRDNQNHRENWLRERIQETRGDFIVKWSQPLEKTQGLEGRDLADFKVDDIVIMVGEVTKVQEWRGESAVFSRIDYNLLETRRRPYARL